MKKFMVLYMANGAEFENMMKNVDSGAAKEGDGRLDEMDGRPSGVPRRRRSAARENQAGRLARRLGYEKRRRRLFDRSGRLGRRRTKIFGKDHPHLQMPGAWIEIIEIMRSPGCKRPALSLRAERGDPAARPGAGGPGLTRSQRSARDSTRLCRDRNLGRTGLPQSCWRGAGERAWLCFLRLSSFELVVRFC